MGAILCPERSGHGTLLPSYAAGVAPTLHAIQHMAYIEQFSYHSRNVPHYHLSMQWSWVHTRPATVDVRWSRQPTGEIIALSCGRMFLVAVRSIASPTAATAWAQKMPPAPAPAAPPWAQTACQPGDVPRQRAPRALTRSRGRAAPNSFRRSADLWAH